MDTINILAIDPGGNTGVSIFTINVVTIEIVNIETFFIDLEYYDKDNDYEKLKNKLLGLSVSIKHIIDVYNPHILAIEDTFVNYRFPKSAIYLSQYIATIELAVMSSNKFIKIYKYPPKLIKYYVGAKGNADKDMMLARVALIPEITKYINPYHITEHEIDSLAIGYITINFIREDPLQLLILCS